LGAYRGQLISQIERFVGLRKGGQIFRHLMLDLLPHSGTTGGSGTRNGLPVSRNLHWHTRIDQVTNVGAAYPPYRALSGPRRFKGRNPLGRRVEHPYDRSSSFRAR